jgi:hypothetical protein
VPGLKRRSFGPNKIGVWELGALARNEWQDAGGVWPDKLDVWESVMIARNEWQDSGGVWR